MSPRYDVPKAAPEPLREVQLLVNSVDLEHGVEWLPEWLAERGLGATELERARRVREALRALLLANNGSALEPEAVEELNAAAARVRVRLDDKGRPHVVAAGDALDGVVATALQAQLDGTLSRLKACRQCRWSFYDESRNRSAVWCSMQLCGNRLKTRAYRRRLRGT